MEPNSSLIPPSRLTPDTHQRGQDKLTPIQRHAKPIVSTRQRLPPWIRAKLPIGSTLAQVKSLLRQQGLATVCEEASCPNLGECFSHGTATFMIMGDRCTRRCPYCDVAHGKPAPLDVAEPLKLATAVQHLNLKYVVITSVTRDDLRDGGASQFTACITQIRNVTPNTKIEILVPDFRGRQAIALDILASNPPDVFNHNIETVPRLYATARPGANYHES
ncbi:lipoyl synthase, partial [Achromatium sp. WMS2]